MFKTTWHNYRQTVQPYEREIGWIFRDGHAYVVERVGTDTRLREVTF